MIEIPLSGKLGAGKYALIDDEDYERVNKYIWNLSHYGYVVTQTLKDIKIKLYMHSFIMNTPKGFGTDHADLNRQNNQKYNLRICTKGQNAANTNPPKINTSGYKGVNPNGKKYMAKICINKKQIYLGLFLTPQLAAQAYNEALLKHYGEYARLNKI